MADYTSTILQEAAVRASAAGHSGCLADEDGCCYEDAVSYLGGQLGFCGCGMPGEALNYIREALVLIDALRKTGYSKEAWDAVQAWGHSDGERYFMWYRLHDLDLTEHGSSAPGWLTAEGERMLEAITEALADEERSH